MKKENTGSTKKAGRLEKVLVPLLIVLVSLLSYSVGILSGKRLSDREYAMKGGNQKHESSHEAGTEHEVASDEDEMSDEEINKVASAAMENAENSAAPVAESASITQAGTAEHGAAPIAAKSSAAIAAPVLAKNNVKEEDRAPSSINRKASDALQYTVQVASYSDFKDAEQMAIALHKKGYPAFSFKVDIKGQTWHRVSIGGYKTKKEALDLQSELVKQGVVKDSYVQRLTR